MNSFRSAFITLLGFSVCSLLLLGCGSRRMGGYDNLERAEELSRAGKYEEAIDAYRDHMNYRLSREDRPEWENPYFYLLLIGDIQVGQGDIQAAESTYNEAHTQGVDPYLISDRFRGIARWYEQRNELKEAIKVLERYRGLDPLLYDSMLDRIARELTRQEEEAQLLNPQVVNQ